MQTDLPITFVKVENAYLKKVFIETTESFKTLHTHPIVLCKRKIKHTTMQAQPIVNSDFFNKRRRAYRVDFRETTLIHEDIMVQDLPETVLKGWYAHELGHIVDYQERGYWNMIKFGFNYLFFDQCKKEAEKMADVYAIRFGFKDEIKEMKEFIINHADIDPKYKSRIKKYYLGPEEIEHIIQEIQEEEDE
jgi:hypothetical protein